MEKDMQGDSEFAKGVCLAESELSALACAVLYLYALSVTGQWKQPGNE